MKIRQGFVSNSSSSSFIVAFPKEPESADEVKALLFPDGRKTYGCYDDSYPVDAVIKAVWKDIQGQTPNDKDAIWDAAHGWLEGQPEIEWRIAPKNPDGSIDMKAEEKIWADEDKVCCEYRQKVIREFYEHNPDAHTYCFHYSDNNSTFESALEHGGLFDALPHIVSSNH